MMLHVPASVKSQQSEYLIISNTFTAVYLFNQEHLSICWVLQAWQRHSLIESLLWESVPSGGEEVRRIRDFSCTVS